MVAIGKSYTFDYPEVFTTLPDYTAHAGQQVRVLREVPDAEAIAGEIERTYEIEAEDGWVGTAWESELLAVGEKRKWRVAE